MASEEAPSGYQERFSLVSMQSSVAQPTARITAYALFSLCAFLAYVLLTRPEIILLSTFAFTTWFPAAGLAFAVLLGISPWFMPLFAFSSAIAGVIFYGQSVLTWSVLLGAPLESLVYACVAHLLRSVLKLDTSLGQRRDVFKYLSGALTAAIVSTLVGVTCLVADHAIPMREFWRTTLTWYFSDAIALFSVAPFLLVHVLPWVRTKMGVSGPDTDTTSSGRVRSSHWKARKVVEVTGQALCFVLVFWFTFHDSDRSPHYYLLFLPILWIAMRGGIRGAVSGLFFVNFGIVCGLQLTGASSAISDELAGVMLFVSGTGLILGSVIAERQATARELVERTSLLNTLVEHSPFGISVVGRSGEVQLINEAFTEMFQYRPAEIVGRELAERIVPTAREVEARDLVEKLQAGQSVVRDFDLLRKDGRLLNVSLHALPWFKNGAVQGRYLIYRDISEQTKAARAAKEYQEAMQRWVGELELRTMEITLLNEMSRLLQCAESSQEAHRIAAQMLSKLFGNAECGALYIMNSTRNTLETAAVWGHRDPMQSVFAPAECWAIRLGRAHSGECPGPSIQCEHMLESLPTNYLCAPLMARAETLGVLHIEWMAKQSTGEIEVELKNQESYGRLATASASQIALSLTNLRLRESLREQSIRDPLTGLFNRRFMQEALEKELQRAKRRRRPVSVVFLDIDHFKRFNDEFGHEAGDSVLRSLADILRVHFRAEDVICRYGGEEFAVILPEASLEDALARAEALRLAARETKLVHRGISLKPMTLSAGIAGFPAQTEDAAELLERADQCLYTSKANGRDQVTVADAGTAI